MSALTAVFNRNHAPFDQELLYAMLAARPERGPHGTRAVIKENVALAHQHFWLLPQERGEEQPLQDGSIILSADVRLDNRQELESQLGLSTMRAETASDARLLLLSYRRWGEYCLDHLLGDFAFALWDNRKKRLFCARDPLGVRDLCYYQTDECFLAASEISQLLAHPAVEPRINEKRVAAFLARLWDDSRHTFLEDIYYLPPAHALIVTAQETRQWRYWDIDEGKIIRYKEEADYVEQYRSILAEAVGCRLRANGPIAVSLSGGLDSSALAALAAPTFPLGGQEQLLSYSYAFDELASCDERRYIQPIIDRYRIKEEFIPCDDRWTLKNLPEWPISRDFVLSDPFAWLPDAVMKAAQNAGVQLLIAGYFGDTLAGGSHYWALDMMRDGRLGMLANIMRKYPSSALLRTAVLDRGLRQFLPFSLTNAYRTIRPRKINPVAPGIHPYIIDKGNLVQRLSSRTGREKFKTPGFGNRYEALIANSFSQGIAATRYQYNQHGLEIVSPYLDRRLVEFIMAVPAYILGRPGYSRLLQRRSMIDHLPEIVWQRQQRTTFVPLMVKGLQEKERETVRRILKEPLIVKRQYVKHDWLQQQLEKPYELSSAGSFFWDCIALELWLKCYWS